MSHAPCVPNKKAPTGAGAKLIKGSPDRGEYRQAAGAARQVTVTDCPVALVGSRNQAGG